MKSEPHWDDVFLSARFKRTGWLEVFVLAKFLPMREQAVGD